MIRTPRRVPTSSSRPTGSGAPPDTHRRMCAASAETSTPASWRSRSISAQNIVGTPHHRLTRSASIVVTTACGSKRGSSTSVLPLWTPETSWQTCPNEWKSGRVISDTTG